MRGNREWADRRVWQQLGDVIWFIVREQGLAVFRVASRLTIPILAILILTALSLFPILRLMIFGFVDGAGSLNLSPIIGAFSIPGMVQTSLNSIELVVLVSAGSFALGVPMAWLATRTDMPGKLFIRLSAALAFVIPSFITVIAWMFLAAPTSGLLNVLFRHLFGLTSSPFDVVSFGGLAFIETAHLYPIVFFTVASALSNIDSSQEQVARILGAGRLRTAIAVTLPLVLPAITSGVLLVALDAMSSFGAPATIGTMANFSVLTTKIYDLLAFPPKLEFAAAGSLPIVAFALLCLFLQKRLINGEHYHTLLSKSDIAPPIALGLGKGIALLFCALIAFATAILPVAALVIQSMLKAFGTDITLDAMTMKNFETLIDPSFPVLAAIRHSLSLASLTVVICLLLGVIFAWIVERTSLKGRGAIAAIIMLTYGFPAMIFAIAIMLCYLKFFYGTFTILLIPYVAKNLPIAFTLFVSGLKQAAPELEEAAHVAGAGWKQTMIHVSLPLLKSSAWVSAMLIFALALRELSMSAILTQPRTAVMSTVVLGFLETGAVEMAAAVSLVIVVLCLVALLLAKAVFRERGLPRVLKRMADGRTADP